MNYFTNCIKVNNRLILGGTDMMDRENNSVFMVKAVVKSTSTKTFAKAGSNGIEDIPLVVLALDKADGDKQDDYENRIPVNAPMYFVPQEEPIGEYYITIGEEKNGKEDIDREAIHTLVMGETDTFYPRLILNDTTIETKFNIEAKLNGIKVENWKNYFTLVENEDGSFSITDVKMCNRGNLEVVISCEVSDNVQGRSAPQKIEATYKFKLGGFY